MSLGVGVGVGVKVGVGVGVDPPMAVTTLKTPVVARVSASIVPEATNGERSAVDVRMEYCTAVPAGWGGIVAE